MLEIPMEDSCRRHGDFGPTPGGFRMRIKVRTVADLQGASATTASRRGAVPARQQILFCRAYDGVRIAYAKSGAPGAPRW